MRVRSSRKVRGGLPGYYDQVAGVDMAQEFRGQGGYPVVAVDATVVRLDRRSKLANAALPTRGQP